MGDGRSRLQQTVRDEVIRAPELRLFPEVYEPLEDSYLLAEIVGKKAFGKVLDMGTGSGIQGIIAAKNGCEVTFADIDRNAIRCARLNAKLSNVPGRFVVTNLFEKIDDKFNTIIFNPPYVTSDPIDKLNSASLALDGGFEGREVIDRFLESYKDHLLPKHTVFMVESSTNNYQKDVERLDARIVGKTHIFFEDIVVLEFK
jgi:release factor glutamine methyltransferase